MAILLPSKQEIRFIRSVVPGGGYDPDVTQNSWLWEVSVGHEEKQIVETTSGFLAGRPFCVPGKKDEFLNR